MYWPCVEDQDVGQVCWGRNDCISWRDSEISSVLAFEEYGCWYSCCAKDKGPHSPIMIMLYLTCHKQILVCSVVQMIFGHGVHHLLVVQAFHRGQVHESCDCLPWQFKAGLHNEAASKRSPLEYSNTIIESQVRVRTRFYVSNQNRNTYNITKFLRGHVWSALGLYHWITLLPWQICRELPTETNHTQTHWISIKWWGCIWLHPYQA